MDDPIHSQAPTFPETADIETSSDEYAARFAGATGQWMLAVQERIVEKMVRDVSPREILDVGGGHGQLAIPLCQRGYSVTVVGSAESCRCRLASVLDSGQCRFMTGDVTALPFPDRSFDLVLCFRLLTHCEHWPKLAEELCRVSRSAVIVDYPCRQSLNRIAPALFGAKKKLEGNTRTWRLFRHQEISGEFAKHGYAPAARCGQFFLHMVLHRTLRCRPLSAMAEAAARLLGLTRLWGSPVIVRMNREASLQP